MEHPKGHFPIIRFLLIFALPALLSHLYLRDFTQCYQLSIDSAKALAESPNSQILQEKINATINHLEQLDERFSSIAQYDAFLTYKYRPSNEIITNASGTIISNKQIDKIKTSFVCESNPKQTVFEDTKQKKIISSQKIDSIFKDLEDFRKTCGKIEFEYDPPPIPPMGILSIKLSGDMCVETRPTSTSLFMAYIIFLSLIVGFIQILKYAISFILEDRRNNEQ